MAKTETFAVFQLAHLMVRLLNNIELGKPTRPENAELRAELRRLQAYLKELK